MDWIHCNGCFIQPGDFKGRKFWLTGCGHMFCDECLIRGPNNTFGCRVCKKPCSTRLLTPPNLQGEVREYFSSIDSLIEKLVKVMDFQNDHRQRLVEYNKAMTKKYNGIQKQCKEFYVEIQKLQQKVTQLEKENIKLKQSMANAASINFQFPGNTPSPYYVPKPGIFTPQSTPSSQKLSHPRTKPMKMINVYGTQRTPDSLHFPSPLASAGTPNIQDSTPDYVSQLRRFSFAYPPNSQD